MIAPDERREKLREISRRGVSVPHTAYGDIERELPTAQTRAWSWWAAVWSRPSARTTDVHESILAAAQEQWDAGEAFVENQRALRAEHDRKAADAEREREAADDAKRAQEADALKADLRTRYLAMPGTTAAEFDTEYPALLADHRRRQMAEQIAADEQGRAAMRTMIRRTL